MSDNDTIIGGETKPEGEIDTLDLVVEAAGEGRETGKGEDDYFRISKPKMALVKKLIANIKENNDKLRDLLGAALDSVNEESIGISQMADENFPGGGADASDRGRIIEGVFDGENMIGPDGKQYTVPANYASKSKLVEGDILKLTITPKGTFIYKQIGPIERSRLIATLEQSQNGSFIAVVGEKRWRLLTASVTYYKAQAGDEVVILVPKNGDSKWAAVENVVKNQ